MHEEFDPRFREVLAQLVGVLEDAHHRLGDAQVVVDRYPLAERHRVLRHDREPAAGDDAEALGWRPVYVADLGDEAEVVDLRVRLVHGTAGEGDLELARQQLRKLVAHEVAHESAGVRRDVEGLVGAHASPGVACHVAHRVSTRFAGGEPYLRHHPKRLAGAGQRDVVQLHVLARGDVALAQRSELLGDAAERVELIRGHAAERQLHADHLPVRLALAVDPLLEAESDEGPLLAVAVEEGRRLRLEVFKLLLEDRNHEAGAVASASEVVRRGLGRHRAPPLPGLDGRSCARHPHRRGDGRLTIPAAHL